MDDDKKYVRRFDAISKEHLIGVLKSYQGACKDIDASIGQIEFVFETGKSYCYVPPPVSQLNEYYDLSRYSQGQILSLMGIPASYFNKCPTDLQCSNFNYWKSCYRNKKIVLRTFKNRVRGIVSPRFNTCLDNVNVVGPLFSAIEKYKDPNFRIRHFDMDDKITRFGVIFPELAFDFDAKETKHTVHAGLVFTNSEVGAAALKIKPVILYAGFLVPDTSSEAELVIRHSSGLDPEKIKSAVAKIYDSVQVGLHQIAVSGNQYIEKSVNEELDQLERKSNYLTKRLVNVVKEDLEGQEEVTRLKLATKILIEVRKLPLFQMAKATEEVGRYLDLFHDSKKKEQAIKKQLSRFSKLEI